MRLDVDVIRQNRMTLESAAELNSLGIQIKARPFLAPPPLSSRTSALPVPSPARFSYPPAAPMNFITVRVSAGMYPRTRPLHLCMSTYNSWSFSRRIHAHSCVAYNELSLRRPERGKPRLLGRRIFRGTVRQKRNQCRRGRVEVHTGWFLRGPPRFKWWKLEFISNVARLATLRWRSYYNEIQYCQLCSYIHIYVYTQSKYYPRIDMCAVYPFFRVIFYYMNLPLDPKTPKYVLTRLFLSNSFFSRNGF